MRHLRALSPCGLQFEVCEILLRLVYHSERTTSDKWPHCARQSASVSELSRYLDTGGALSLAMALHGCPNSGLAGTTPPKQKAGRKSLDRSDPEYVVQYPHCPSCQRVKAPHSDVGKRGSKTGLSWSAGFLVEQEENKQLYSPYRYWCLGRSAPCKRFL